MRELSATYADANSVISAVLAAREPARNASGSSTLAAAFIGATSCYQAALLNALAQHKAEEPALFEDYYEARSALTDAKSSGQATQDAQQNLIAVEKRICEKFPSVQEHMNEMLSAGKAFMLTRPKLALQLDDLPPSVRLWNQIKLVARLGF